MNIGTFAAGAFSKTLQYCPQRIGIRFNATGGLTGNLVVTSNKEGQILSLSEADIKAWSQSFMVAVMNATDDVFYIDLAAGRIDEDTVTISGTCTGASGIDLYAQSDTGNPTGVYYNTVGRTVVLQTNECIEKFSKAVIVAMGATDVLNYSSADGMVNEPIICQWSAPL